MATEKDKDPQPDGGSADEKLELRDWQERRKRGERRKREKAAIDPYDSTRNDARMRIQRPIEIFRKSKAPHFKQEPAGPEREKRIKFEVLDESDDSEGPKSGFDPYNSSK